MVVHVLLDSLIHGDCSDALPLKHQNAECDEDQSQQSSNGKGFLQEHESNEQDDAHLCCVIRGDDESLKLRAYASSPKTVVLAAAIPASIITTPPWWSSSYLGAIPAGS